MLVGDIMHQGHRNGCSRQVRWKRKRIDAGSSKFFGIQYLTRCIRENDPIILPLLNEFILHRKTQEVVAFLIVFCVFTTNRTVLPVQPVTVAISVSCVCRGLAYSTKIYIRHAMSISGQIHPFNINLCQHQQQGRPIPGAALHFI
jgi:hypothetical protein